jgi:uncharacterized repeat protein (TIGR01451 family)
MRKRPLIGWFSCLGLAVFGIAAFAFALRDSGAQAPTSDPFGSTSTGVAASTSATTPTATTPAGSRIRFPSSSEPGLLPTNNNPYAATGDRYPENPIRRTAAETPIATTASSVKPTAAAPLPTAAMPADSRYAPAPTARYPTAAQSLQPQTLPPQTLPTGSAVGAASILVSPSPSAALPSSLPTTTSPYPPAPTSAYPPSTMPAAVAPTPAYPPAATPITSASNPLSTQPTASASEGTGRPGEKALEGAQQPTLLIEKLAPPEIQVGKAALFEIHVRNAGQATAHDVEVHDLVPQGTQLVEAKPQAKRGTRGELVWALGALRPGDEQVLTMELMPTTEGEIGSTATVRFSAAASARTLCTKPELVVDVQAPRSVLAGDNVPLKIRISNPGTGAATGILLTEVVPANMTHEGGAELEYEVGDLQPNESRELELVLRAVKPGQVMNLLHAKGAGKLATEAKTPIEVVAPALALEIEGPKKRFLDRQATYTVSIANPGTAAAREVELATFLPRGLQFVDANNNGEYDAATHSVRWLLEELPPRERGSVSVTMLPIEPGQQLLRIESTADRGVNAQKEEAIMVEGAASVAFQVVDTADPIEVGGETTYEVVVTNQGSKEATNVQLAVTLPEGLKALDADGPTRFTMNGRQVQFQALAQLPPKGETIYRVKVQCLAQGDHRCHVQLLSDDMKTPVSKEEGTRVYADE